MALVRLDVRPVIQDDKALDIRVVPQPQVDFRSTVGGGKLRSIIVERNAVPQKFCPQLSEVCVGRVVPVITPIAGENDLSAGSIQDVFEPLDFAAPDEGPASGGASHRLVAVEDAVHIKEYNLQ